MTAPRAADSLTGKLHAMTVSDPGRFIYVRTAKVATRSISAALASRPELEAHMRRGKMQPWPSGKRRDYAAFAFVRNPYTRLVSCWQNKVLDGTPWQYDHLRDLTLPEFVTVLEGMDLTTADRHVRTQTALLPLDRLTFLGRLERIAADWEQVCALLGLDVLPLPRENVSGPSREPVHLDDALAERIRRLYALDFAMFGYSTEVPERLR